MKSDNFLPFGAGLKGLERQTPRIREPLQHRPWNRSEVQGLHENAPADNRCQPASIYIVGQADIKLDAERASDFVGEEMANGSPVGVDPAQELAFVPAEGVGVVAPSRARNPVRGLRSEDLPVPIVVGHDLDVDRDIVKRGDAGLVFQELANSHPFFAGLGEFGPVSRHWLLEVEQASAVGNGHRDCGHALRRGEDRRQRVSLPRLRALLVAMPAPEVDHQLTIVDDGNCGPELSPFPEVLPEGVSDRPEPFGDVPLITSAMIER